MKVFGRVHLKLELGSLHIEHLVVVVDKIAHNFILGNDLLVAHGAILNSEGKIVFGSKPVPYTLLRSTINLICPVICQARTEIEPYEEAFIPGLLPNQTLPLEPRKNELIQPFVVARSSSADSRVEHQLRTCDDS